MQTLLINVRKTTALSAAFIVFVYTFFLGALFLGGDQEHYRAVYEISSQNNIFDSYAYYRLRIQSDELGHFFITWIAAQFFDKDFINAVFNAVLAYYSVRLLCRWGAHPMLACAISVFGYYHLALYVSAERLKYATIFFAIWLYYLESRKISFIALFLSLTSHLQYSIMFVSTFLAKYSFNLVSLNEILKIKKHKITYVLGSSVFLSLIFIFFSDHIIYKFQAYSKGYEWSEYIRILIFAAGSFLYSKNKNAAFWSFLPLVIMVGLVGGDRINLYGYFLFLYFALPINKGFNLGVILTFMYYLFGWFEYSSLVIECGINRPC